MDSSDEEVLLLLAVAEDDNDRRKKKKKWVHDINLQRHSFGEYHTLMEQLRRDERRFYIYFRMTTDKFDEILNLIEYNIRKMDTNYREAISPEERLAIAIRFLATGDSYTTIGHSFRVGFTTVGAIVREVCQAICDTMQVMYMPELSTATWNESADGFNKMWQFPNCIGSIDGKHVTIKCPNKSGSNYFCYLHKFSIVLLTIVGPDYKFLCADIGGYGKNSDGGILQHSLMGQRLEAGTLGVPSEKNLPGQNEPAPHVIIGDEAFPLKSYLMKPFPYRQSRGDRRKETYNYRLCRARRVVENAFGILAQKWRIYYRPIEVNTDTAKLIIRTTCILHNFLRGNTDYFEHLDPPEPNLGAFGNAIIDARRAPTAAFADREKIVEFFSTHPLTTQ